MRGALSDTREGRDGHDGHERHALHRHATSRLGCLASQAHKSRNGYCTKSLEIGYRCLVRPLPFFLVQSPVTSARLRSTSPPPPYLAEKFPCSNLSTS